MVRYLYLDYGGLPKYRRELKYSLISLRQDAPAAQIAIYTDAPQVYANWPVTAVDIGPRLAEWSGQGLYHHRIKPAVVLDALRRFESPVCFVDTDSIIQPGFDAQVRSAMTPREEWSVTKTAVVMNYYERRNPFPPLKGFSTRLPHLGLYRYDTVNSWMFNSGLIGVSPGHEPILEDTLAMIDALIGRAKKFDTLEQFALGEAIRLRQIPITAIRETFLHYWQGRRRIYMANEITKSLSPDWDDLTPPTRWAHMHYWNVLLYNYYHGIGHALGLLT